MKKYILVLGVLVLFCLSSCQNSRTGNILVSREFPTQSWERFDFIEKTIVLEKPVSYDLDLDVTFDKSYDYNYFSVVFSVFDANDNPLRSKEYKFTLKDREGQWKSELEDGQYHFRFPINSELTLNEPDTYKFQLENHMPITPLLGIKQISIINK